MKQAHFPNTKITDSSYAWYAPPQSLTRLSGKAFLNWCIADAEKASGSKPFKSHWGRASAGHKTPKHGLWIVENATKKAA